MNTSIEDEQRRVTEINIALYEAVDGVKEVIEQSQEPYPIPRPRRPA